MRSLAGISEKPGRPSTCRQGSQALMGIRVWRTPEAMHVDVCGLDPPQPMLTILRLLDQAGADEVIVAHLDREPIFLYPELDDRGWRYALASTPDEEASPGGEVRLRLFR